MSLVTCDKLGNSLINWINTASQEDKDALADALGIKPDQLAAVFNDCEGSPQMAGVDLVTCLAMQQYVTDAIDGLNMDSSIHTDNTVTVNLFGDGTTTDPLTGEVRLSATDGNLIQKRSDGLYLGTEAPPDTQIIYVNASTGNNANVGSEAAPVKTIRHAMSMGPANVQRAIRLREGQTHHIDVDPNPPYGTTGGIDLRGGTILIFPYGPVFDAGFAVNGFLPDGMDAAAAAGVSPVLVSHSGYVDMHTGSPSFGGVQFRFLQSTFVSLDGLILRVNSYSTAVKNTPGISSGDTDQFFHGTESEYSKIRIFKTTVELHGQDPIPWGYSILDIDWRAAAASPGNPTRVIFQRVNNAAVDTKWLDAYPSATLQLFDRSLTEVNAASVITGTKKNNNPVWNFSSNINPDLLPDT